MPISCPGAHLSVNGRTYRVPARPVVAICIDGCADEYLNAAITRGRMPHVARMELGGFRRLVRGALPSFTNVNNCAIVTGTPPSATGISGNYIIDPETGRELMTNSSRFLRNDTILAAAAAAGRKVAMVTSKDKLRELLSKGMRGIAFSAEKAAEVNVATHGLDNVIELVGAPPSIYSAEASLYVLRAGVVLLERGLADFLYLSLTDYIQHKFVPEAPEALDFYARIDEQVGSLLALGAIVAITADHGMNGKSLPDGRPNVLYLETKLTERFDPGIRVICPITDPYVVHHGALGSAVTVYLPASASKHEVASWILQLDGVAEVYSGEDAARKLELPIDRIGDLFVLAERDVVIGRTPAHHDLSNLTVPLRSHGGRYEEMVPMLISEPMSATYLARAQGDPRNFDLFDYLCNGPRAAAG